MNFWRAPTENDLNSWGDERAAIRWRAVGYRPVGREGVRAACWSASRRMVRITVDLVRCSVKEGAELPPAETPEQRVMMLGAGLNMILNDQQLDA